MKKNYFFTAIFGLFLTSSFAQQTNIDFENFNLSQADTFYNGSDFNGGFSYNSFGNTIGFSNYFDTTWGPYWTGFSYSNMTDNITAGYQNQYSAYTGIGSQGSEKYAIYYSDGMISFSQNTIIDSIKITNTTYAALSMLNGDSFSKQFGSPNNAGGTDDGTNGQDYFKIWIIALDANLNKIDSVEFYLADYRFSDNSQDYIVDTWQNVNLSPLGSSVRSLTFRFESSDMSGIYINTPTYFALDDLHITNVLSNVDEISGNTFKTFPNPIDNQLIISGLSGQLTITNPEGKIILSQKHTDFTSLDFSAFEKGIYFVSIENEQNKKRLTQKVIK